MHENTDYERMVRASFILSKVKKILKGSLDSISSPSRSVKIQIMGGKVCLRHTGKTLLGIVANRLFVFKSLLTISRFNIGFAFTPFPPII